MLDGIIGHERIVERLKRQAEQGRLAHAYLFIGQEGVGKTAVAMGLIGSGSDFQQVSRREDEKTGKLKVTISVDQIRELRDRLSLTSFSGETKAAFIEEADRLSDGAANALLKTLEEPRGDTVIILRAETLESVSQTIASRCQVLRFCPVPSERR
ncbi:AAA family ATPase, partial [bacterium]|nr:AAA family ATPase [bacterium]